MWVAYLRCLLCVIFLALEAEFRILRLPNKLGALGLLRRAFEAVAATIVRNVRFMCEVEV